MLDKILNFIADKLDKTPKYNKVSMVTLSTTKGTKYTATTSGLMLIRANATDPNKTGYCYMDATFPNSSGQPSIATIRCDFTTGIACVPMVEGAVYNIYNIGGIKDVNLLIFPFEKIGGGSAI